MKKLFQTALFFTATLFIVDMVTSRRKEERINNAAANPNVQAFLKMIRYAEGTSGPNGYQTMFTGKLFSVPPWQHPNIKNFANGITSTAAGAYQFLYSTWSELAADLNLSDFSPANQDKGAIELIRQRKALDDVEAGNFETAITKVNRVWASLPGSPYGQPVKTLAELRNVYETYGGDIA